MTLVAGVAIAAGAVILLLQSEESPLWLFWLAALLIAGGMILHGVS